MKAKVNRVAIEIIQDDILGLSTDALVITTDPNLTLSPALASRIGPDVQRECREIGWRAVGAAAMTSAGRLPFAKIIHAVGPRWGEGSERAKLALVTLEVLRLAESAQIRSLAIPAISTGPLGYPVESCAKVMLTQIIDFTFEDLKYLRSVVICVDNGAALQVFESEYARQIQDLKKSGEGKVKV